jgi:hypothetical protein
MAYADVLSYVESLDEESKSKLAESLLGRLGKYDVPLRELEYCTYTFDLVMDQGAYAEFKRHRMMTQTPQRLTTRLGYATPRLMTEAGFGSQYEAAMERGGKLYEKLHDFNPALPNTLSPTDSTAACWRSSICGRRLRSVSYVPRRTRIFRSAASRSGCTKRWRMSIRC